MRLSTAPGQLTVKHGEQALLSYHYRRALSEKDPVSVWSGLINTLETPSGISLLSSGNDNLKTGKLFVSLSGVVKGRDTLEFRKSVGKHTTIRFKKFDSILEENGVAVFVVS